MPDAESGFGPPLDDRVRGAVPFDRRDVRRTARRVLAAAVKNPYWLLRGGAFLAGKLWQARRALWRRQRIGKMTFFIHDFMDASALDPERIRNCSFMVMTEQGPISMCEVNSRRDDFILDPFACKPIRARRDTSTLVPRGSKSPDRPASSSDRTGLA